jgi:hypothetical protein
MFPNRDKELNKANYLKINKELECFYAERKYIKCMRNTGDDFKECMELFHNWNKCMDDRLHNIIQRR